MTPTIDALYEAHPALQRAEQLAEHRVEERKAILRLLEPGTVGAELGVFTGLFSEALLAVVRPAMLHLVDPWWHAFGETYPDWGKYTDYGRLPTRVAHEATLARVEAARGDCEVRVHVAASTDWLRSLPDASLDWAYVDSTHFYKDTLGELRLLAKKIRREGLVLGDDWRPRPTHVHHGVFRAVHEEVRAGRWDLVRADEFAQWAIRPAASYPIVERLRMGRRERRRRRRR